MTRWASTTITRPTKLDAFGRPFLTTEQIQFMRRCKNRAPQKRITLHGIERHEAQETLTRRELI